MLAAFAAASLLRSSDYTYMKGVRYQDIPKRKSFHVNVQSLPSNSKYYAPEEDDDGILIGFSLNWLRGLPALSGIDIRYIIVAMSDGSLSEDKHGRCCFFAALLSFVDGNADEAALLKAMRRQSSIWRAH